MPKAYWVVTYRSVKNPEAWKAYAKLAVPAIESAGGRSRAQQSGKDLRSRDERTRGAGRVSKSSTRPSPATTLLPTRRRSRH